MNRENETKPCPCCNQSEALMIHVGIGWKCTVCSYMETDDYNPVPPKKTFKVKVKYVSRGKGKPRPISLDDVEDLDG